MPAADRGKIAERKLQAYLSALATRSHNMWLRIPDAHGGSKTAKPSDFLYMQNGKLYVLECKSTLHEYRLPHGNVDTAQIGRMRRWEMAGARSFVAVYHETLDKWRLRHVDYFLERTGGSWDFRIEGDTPRTLEEILGEIVQ